jgi:hypothetical protein
MSGARRIAFRRIADAALARAETIVQRWLTDGRRDGESGETSRPVIAAAI